MGLTTQIQAGINEVAGIMRAVGVSDLWLLQADTNVACEPRRVRINDLANLTIHGRGGTSFRDALARLTRLRPKPQLAVYFTDGYGDSPTEAPVGIDIIWCIVPSGFRTDQPAAFGKVIVMHNEGEPFVYPDEDDDDDDNDA